MIRPVPLAFGLGLALGLATVCGQAIGPSGTARAQGDAGQDGDLRDETLAAAAHAPASAMAASRIAADGAAGREDADLTAQALARRAAADLRAAVAALESAREGRAGVAALTETIRAYEAGLTALRDALRTARVREAAITRRLEGQRDRIARLLGVLAGMQQAPGPLLLLHPSGPLATARSGMIIADVTPALQAEAGALRTDLEEVAALRSLEQSALATVTEGLIAVQEARVALNTALAERTTPPAPLTDDPDALRRLIASATTLDDFARGLVATPLPAAGPGEDRRAFTAAKGSLHLPAFGTLLHGFGTADAAGITRPGMIVATRPRALVASPWNATVRFAGPLLDYANVMILEPELGYLIVLAGLDQVYVAQGTVVSTGEALGLMGGIEPLAAEFLDPTQEGGGRDRGETLYIELRVGDAPVDPSSWFAETRE